MIIVVKKTNPPSITSNAFDCPHCGAFSGQNWFLLNANQLYGNKPIPERPTPAMMKYLGSPNIDPKMKASRLEWIGKMERGLVFFDRNNTTPHRLSQYIRIHNLYISECYSCKELAVWVDQSLVFPPQREGEMPNVDLPDDIVRDFEEARSIINLSPRGAAALLRLSVQKLCAHLGEKGKKLDDDIANLVRKGLDARVQRALDIVRVIGNEAVHPGTIDLKDDRDTALKLLGLVNLIVDQMISHPKNIQDMYDKLPIDKRVAIERRNKRAHSDSDKEGDQE
ncbi:MAG TPA: DUF4145 domain-containing protein [Thermoanaerobaculia bacterium]|jgi:hypothetical protein|nr:DUF4145 domain-containing protein [Thermoanaerobaculia bacterium]